MEEFKEWKWLLKTNKGEFFMTVFGRWSREEAAGKVQLLFGSLNINILDMIPRKFFIGSKDRKCTILEAFELGALDPELVLPPPLGFEFIAGKKWWQAFGIGALYEAERIVKDKW